MPGIPVAHPGLTRLFAGSYAVEAQAWVDKMSGVITETPSATWSEGRYQALLGGFDHLSPALRRTWNYYKLWPNLAFDVYPDQVDFMQFIPVSATEAVRASHQAERRLASSGSLRAAMVTSIRAMAAGSCSEAQTASTPCRKRFGPSG